MYLFKSQTHARLGFWNFFFFKIFVWNTEFLITLWRLSNIYFQISSEHNDFSKFARQEFREFPICKWEMLGWILLLFHFSHNNFVDFTFTFYENQSVFLKNIKNIKISLPIFAIFMNNYYNNFTILQVSIINMFHPISTASSS